MLGRRFDRLKNEWKFHAYCASAEVELSVLGWDLLFSQGWRGGLCVLGRTLHFVLGSEFTLSP